MHNAIQNAFNSYSVKQYCTPHPYHVVYQYLATVTVLYRYCCTRNVSVVDPIPIYSIHVTWHISTNTQLVKEDSFWTFYLYYAYTYYVHELLQWIAKPKLDVKHSTTLPIRIYEFLSCWLNHKTVPSILQLYTQGS